VVKELEEADLAHDSFGVDQILEGLRHLLDGNLDVVDVIISATYHTVRAMTDLFDVLKLLFDAESSAYRTKLNVRVSQGDSALKDLFTYQHTGTPLCQFSQPT